MKAPHCKAVWLRQPRWAGTALLLSGLVTTSQAQTTDLTPVRVMAPSSVSVGDSIGVTVVTKNGGTVAVSTLWNLQVLLSLDTLITASDPVITTIAVSRLIRAGARDSMVVRVPIPAKTQPGSYYLGVQVDATNALAELNEKNNFGRSTNSIQVASRWDLTVGLLTVPDSIRQGSTLLLTVPVRNLGTGAVPGGWIGRVYLSKDGIFSSDDRYLGDFPFDQALAAGATANVALTYSLPVWGDYRVIAIMDGDNIRGEVGEGNNIVPSPAVLHIWPPFVDLAGSIDAAPLTAYSTGEAAETFPVMLTVRNLGTIMVEGGWEGRLFLSSNNNIWGSMENPQDQLLGTFMESRTIPPGGSVSEMVNVSLPKGLTWTQWYLGLKVDPANTVPEIAPADPKSDHPSYRGGGNNEAARTIQVTGLPNLQVSSATGTLTPGTTSNLAVTIRNDGMGAAPGGWQLQLCLEGPNGALPMPVPRTTCGDPYSYPWAVTVPDRLAGGTSQTINAGVSLAGGVFPGAYTIRWLADAAKVVPETNDGDNDGLGTGITVATVYDLLAVSLSWDQQTFKWTRVGIRCNCPAGVAVPDGWNLQFLLSTTPADQASWRLVTETGWPRGTTSVTNEQFFPMTMAPRPGDYLIVVLDNRKWVPETSETNNTLVSAQPLLPPSP